MKYLNINWKKHLKPCQNKIKVCCPPDIVLCGSESRLYDISFQITPNGNIQVFKHYVCNDGHKWDEVDLIHWSVSKDTAESDTLRSKEN